MQKRQVALSAGSETSEGSDFLTVASLPELVYERVRQDISTGTLQPGRLSISQLAGRFGVSSIPIREALRRLEAEGLVSFQGNRSVVITSLEAADVVEIFAIRSELECLALRLSCPRLRDDDAALAHLDGLVQQMDRELEAPDAWLTTNARFHTALYERADSPRLLSLIRTLWVSVEPYLRVYASSGGSLLAAQEEHRELAQCAKAGWVDQAQAVLRRHLDATQKIVIGRLRRPVADRPRVADRTAVAAGSPVEDGA